VPGSSRAIEIAPTPCFTPVWSVGSCAIGGSRRLGSFCAPPLDQAVRLLAPVQPHGAIEHRAVQPLFIHIAQEIGRGDRCAFRLQRDHDVAQLGMQHDIG